MQSYINYSRWTIVIFGYCLAFEQPKLYTSMHFFFLSQSVLTHVCFYAAFSFCMIYLQYCSLYIEATFCSCHLFFFTVSSSVFCQFLVQTHTHTHTHTHAHTHLACAPSFTMHLYEFFLHVLHALLLWYFSVC